MKSKQPPRYEEILTALRDNPNGMTTGQILTWSKKQSFSDLKDSTMISYIVHTLRNKKMPTSTQTDDGNVHNITQLGLDQLTDDDDKQNTTEVNRDYDPSTNQPVAPVSLQGMVAALIDDAKPSDDPLDIVEQLDETVSVLRCALIKSMEAKKLKIARKDEKIAVLEKLEPLFSEDIAECLHSIKCDLLQCDGE